MYVKWQRVSLAGRGGRKPKLVGICRDFLELSFSISLFRAMYIYSIFPCLFYHMTRDGETPFPFMPSYRSRHRCFENQARARHRPALRLPKDDSGEARMIPFCYVLHAVQLETDRGLKCISTPVPVEDIAQHAETWLLARLGPFPSLLYH